MKLVVVCFFAVAVSAFGQEPAPAPAALAVRDGAVAALRAAFEDHARFWEQRVARELSLRERGAGSDYTIAFFQFYLAMARHDLAVLDRKPEVRVDQARLARDAAARQLAVTLESRQRGAASETDIDAAKRHLAAARWRLALAEAKPVESVLQLRLLIGICKKELDRLEGLQAKDAVPELLVDDARYRLACACFLLARAQGTSAERAEQRRIMVAVARRVFLREQALHKTRAANDVLVDNAERTYVYAQLYQAIEAKESVRSREFLGRLAELTDKRLRYLTREAKVAEEEERAFLARELALWRFQLATFDDWPFFMFPDEALELDA
jgi:hypothetical protein